jgi:tetratricopeptide (TPR) repeat protein
MRIVIWSLAGALLLAGAAPRSLAEEATPPSIAPVQPDKPEASRSERLDGLFATLKSTKSSSEAKVAEGSILRLWLESGSDTIDLLMDWAIKAIDAKNYPLALDYLDRVVTMKPDYAEGWNKRATVYFLTDDYKKSIFDIERTLALEPRHFGALSGLGMIMRDIGQDKRAIDAFKRALAVDPYLDNVKKALDDIQVDDAGKEI